MKERATIEKRANYHMAINQLLQIFVAIPCVAGKMLYFFNNYCNIYIYLGMKTYSHFSSQKCHISLSK